MAGASEAERFVHFLLNEGAKHVCDESTNAFANCESLPSFFDKLKFERGQRFYQKNKFGMFLGMYISMVVGLSVPWMNKILMMTYMSDTPKAAYKRYVQTYHYINLWYSEAFDQDSSLFRSLSTIRKLHNNASNKASRNDLSRITQRDMALAQMLSYGFLMINAERFGIHHATDEDKEAVLHVWRVIGFMLGVEDRFNVCSSSVEETREIVSMVFLQVVVPNVNKREDTFLQLAEALLRGIKITPFPDLDVIVAYVLLSFTNLEIMRTIYVDRLGFLQKLKFSWLTHFINLLKYPFFKAIYTCFLNVYVRVLLYFVPPHFMPSRKITIS